MYKIRGSKRFTPTEKLGDSPYGDLDDKHKIGLHINLRRVQIGLTQKELSQTAGIGLNSLVKLESGKRKNGATVEELASIAIALKCPMEYLLP